MFVEQSKYSEKLEPAWFTLLVFEVQGHDGEGPTSNLNTQTVRVTQSPCHREWLNFTRGYHANVRISAALNIYPCVSSNFLLVVTWCSYCDILLWIMRCIYYMGVYQSTWLFNWHDCLIANFNKRWMKVSTIHLHAPNSKLKKYPSFSN